MLPSSAFRRGLAVAAALVLPLAACVPDTPGRAPVDETVDRAAIASLIAAGIEATRSKDIEGYMAQIPDGITMHDENGDPLSRAEVRARVLALWERIEQTRYLDVVIDTMVMAGDSAVVYTTQTWDRLVTRPDTAIVDTIVSVAQQREIWRRASEGWRAFEILYLSGQTKVNGSVLFQPPGGSP